MITIDLKNYDEVVKGLQDCQKDLAKAVAKAHKDIARRGLKTIAKRESSKVYNITQKDLGANLRTHYKEVGGMTLAGVHIPFYLIEISGDEIPAVKFGSKPTSRPKGKYSVTWKPLRAGGDLPLKSKYGTPPFIFHGKPFSRLGAKRLPIYEITKLQPGEMAENAQVSTGIETEVSNRVLKALSKL